MNQSAIPDEYVLTPHGLQHVSDVRQIDENDHSVIAPPNHLPRDFGALRPRGPAGWIESAIFTPSEPLRSMSVTFKVPEPPLKPGALIYLFPAAENGHLSTILQPVLQYGNNGLFGCDQWFVSCWHCTPDGVSVFSTPIPVEPGQTIIGTIKIIEFHRDSCDWQIEARVIEKPEHHTVLHVYGLEFLLLFIVAGALEAYSLDDLGKFPHWNQFPESGSTTFNHIKLESMTNNRYRADWNTRVTTGDCGFTITVNDDKSSVTLNYP